MKMSPEQKVGLPQYRHYTGLSTDRLYRILYRHVTRYSGYQPFGLDWPTLLTCHPQIGRVMAEIDQLYRDDTT